MKDNERQFTAKVSRRMPRKQSENTRMVQINKR